MPLQIVRQDITKMNVDAIVNPSNTKLIPGGGTDLAIHTAAGSKLQKACNKLGGCNYGEAKITKAYNLPCQNVIHTAGPVWVDGQHNEANILELCYYNCMKLAVENKMSSVAFPLISSGSFGFPKDSVLKIAVKIITQFIMEYDIDVYIVVYDKNAFSLSEKLFTDVRSYIDDNYVDEHRFMRNFRRSAEREMFPIEESACLETITGATEYSDCDYSLAIEPCDEAPAAFIPQQMQAKSLGLDDMIKQIDESFSQMLLRKITEKNMTDAQCYKKANIDRKLFSKIRSNVHYRPRKSTALAFAVALELSLDETNELLMKAGFALSHSDIFDIIVEYFIKNKNYNVFEINEVLFQYDQNLLGS